MKTRLLLTTFLFSTCFSVVTARNYPLGKSAKTSSATAKSAAGCNPGSGRTDLDLNNVRALIYTTGDMWWNHINAPRYEVPKGSNKHSAFAASLWLAGLDDGGNLKSAAMMYRQNGNDFWPGPLQISDASVTPDICQAFDKHWKITRKEVEDFVFGGLPATPVINDWPGSEIEGLNFAGAGFAAEVAPFVDGDGDGQYRPDVRDSTGRPVDYPGYDINGDLRCKAKLFGDQTLWYVFNDKGNIHTETGGFPIGFEIRAQAFAFATNNALNNMTFFNYEIINRSTFTVKETYFGQWSDPDIGNYADDYAGCDVGRGMGYVYNGDDDDETVQGYGLNPPSLGIDFFEGPFEDANGIDDEGDYCVNPRARNGLGYGDGIVDNERIGMARFSYFNGGNNPINGDPRTGQQIYNYLRGFWKDGTDMTYGGDGHGGAMKYSFMFPSDTDPRGIGLMISGYSNQCLPEDQPLDKWDEATLGLAPADRRMVQSAGPFTLDPGAFNKVTVGVVWARASSGGPLASVQLVRRVDDDAQALFDNCFSLINGPDAPFTRVVELDKELILLFEDTYNDNIVYYEDETSVPGFGDVQYKFQGYQIFQLKNLSTTVNDLRDPNLARLVAQCDLRDTISGVIKNRYYNQDIDENEVMPMVFSENKGLRNSFRITTDLFATGDNRLVNHKKYYYLVLSYAVATNVPDDLKPTFPEMYLAGRRTHGLSALQIYTAIPHINSPEFGGTVIQTAYGEVPSMTRIEGQGNGINNIDLTEESIAAILSSPDHWIPNPVYKRNAAPVNLKVVDPLNVPEGEFEFKILGLNDTSKWSLRRISDNDTYTSRSNIGLAVEEVISKWGFAVDLKQVNPPGVDVSTGNGFITASMTYADNTRRWMNFLPDQEGCSNPANWIRSGFTNNTQPGSDPTCNDYPEYDNQQYYENILGGTWAPFQLVSRFNDGPCADNPTFQPRDNMRKLPSVDIVFTPDKSKWSRCPVFETTDDRNYAEGGVEKTNLRAAPSVDKNGNRATPGSGSSTNPDAPNYISDMGMGWFPGYAINIATGERLNIAFGESSRLTEDNGRDMLFNPTSRFGEFGPNGPIYFMGGKHFIYVFTHANDGANDMPRYDAGKYIQEKLCCNPTLNNRRNVWKDCSWVAIPLSLRNQPFLSNELTVRLRVTRPYAVNLNASESVESTETRNNNYPMYTFNTDGMHARKQDRNVAVSALDIINAVPNPYYAYSEYEVNQLDNRVKITNLPQKCQIKIYTSNGTLIRTYQKDDRLTSLDWDMKNQVGVTIASGIYLIHVKVEGVGEKVVKWFGILRPIDLDSF